MLSPDYVLLTSYYSLLPASTWKDAPITPGASSSVPPLAGREYAATCLDEYIGCPVFTGTGPQKYADRPIINGVAPLLQRAQETILRLGWNHGDAPPLDGTFLGTFAAGSTAFTLSTHVQLKEGPEGELHCVNSHGGAPLVATMNGPHKVQHLDMG